MQKYYIDETKNEYAVEVKSGDDSLIISQFGKIKKAENVKEIDGKDLSNELIELMDEITESYLVIKHYESNISKYNDEINYHEKEIDGIKDSIKELTGYIDKYKNSTKKIIKEMNEKIIALNMIDSITGDEIESMSFFNGTLDRIRARLIISKTSRPIVYTYGLKFRKPTTYEVPITIDQALKAVDNDNYLDIKFLEDKIDMNAYSSSDML